MSMKTTVVLFFAGLIILTYGLTRYIVTIEILEQCNRSFAQYKIELNKGFSEMSLNEIQKGVSKLQVEIALSQGNYEFLDGLIALAAIAAGFFACSYYFFRQLKDAEKAKGMESSHGDSI